MATWAYGEQGDLQAAQKLVTIAILIGDNNIQNRMYVFNLPTGAHRADKK